MNPELPPALPDSTVLREDAIVQNPGISRFTLRHNHAFALHTDNLCVRRQPPSQDLMPLAPVPWAMEMKALSVDDPGHLVKTLTGAILGCGGWVLSRGANDSGAVNLLFEFERRLCVEIYSVLVGAGLDLSQNAHLRFTELCHCTRHHAAECGTEIASIDLEVQTLPAEVASGAPAPQWT
jgi:hypothetical protein